MKTMLIIDDEMGIVEEVRDFFSEEGFEVHVADSGKEGLEIIKQKKPHVVILDIKLPDMSGLQVLKEVKEIDAAIKVIVNTGYVDQQIIDEAAFLRCDAFLQKPFNLVLLYNEVDRLTAGV